MSCGKHFLDLNRNRLLIAFSITFLMMILEFLGGLFSNSIALISDAVHMLIDCLALGVSVLAAHWASKPNIKKIGNYYIGEIYAALINGLILCGMALFIIYGATVRFFNPKEVQSVLMTIVAIIGLGVNLVGIILLHKERHQNINVRGAFLHIIGDTFSSAGVIIGGLIIYFSNWHWIDSLLGFLIALMIIRGGWGLIREAIKILKK